VLAAVEEADLVVFVVDTRRSHRARPRDSRILRRGACRRAAANKVDAAPGGRAGRSLPAGPRRARCRLGRARARASPTSSRCSARRCPAPGTPASHRDDGARRGRGRPNVGKSSLVTRWSAPSACSSMRGRARPATRRHDPRLRGRTYVPRHRRIRRKGRVQEALEKLAVVMALKSLDGARCRWWSSTPPRASPRRTRTSPATQTRRSAPAVVVVNKWDLVPRDGPQARSSSRFAIDCPSRLCAVCFTRDAPEGIPEVFDTMRRSRGGAAPDSGSAVTKLCEPRSPAARVVRFARRSLDDPVRLAGRRRAADLRLEGSTGPTTSTSRTSATS